MILDYTVLCKVDNAECIATCSQIPWLFYTFLVSLYTVPHCMTSYLSSTIFEYPLTG